MATEKIREQFDDWASHIVAERESKSDSQLEYEIVEALQKAAAIPSPQTWQPSVEPEVRQSLWLNHGCSLATLYGDDGEMQCNACHVDFKRDPLAKICMLLFALGRLHAGPIPSPQTWQPLETLPDEYRDGKTWVLVTGCNTSPLVLVAGYRPQGPWGGCWVTYGHVHIQPPTHWMPLPDPPMASLRGGPAKE